MIVRPSGRTELGLRLHHPWFLYGGLPIIVLEPTHTPKAMPEAREWRLLRVTTEQGSVNAVFGRTRDDLLHRTEPQS